MLKNTALLAIVAIIFLLVNGSETAPVGLQLEHHQGVSRRSLLGLPDYLLRILGILPTPTEPPQPPTVEPAPATEAEQEMYSGDNSTTLQPVHFNAALVGDIYLSASPLLLNTLTYNFIRIASLENVDLSDNTSVRQFGNDSQLVELHDGIFTAPDDGVYSIHLITNIEVDVVNEDRVNEMGIAFCLNTNCNGHLHNTLSHRTFIAVVGKHSLELSGNFTLEENDAIKFFVYKTPFTGMMLFRETFISGATVLS